MNQPTLVDSFREAMRVGSPFFGISTPDYRQSIKDCAGVRVNGEPERPMVAWDICRGHYPVNKIGKQAAESLGAGEDTVSAPAMALQRAVGEGGKKLPRTSILFMIFSDNEVLQNPITAQAIATVRDEFKADQRILVLLGRDLKLPALIAEDVPLYNEQLPDEEAIIEVVCGVYKSAKLPVNQEEANKAAPYLRGMTRFAVEDVAARKIRKTGLDLEGVAHAQRTVIESSTNRALTFERQNVTFDDIGGQAAIKDFMTKLFAGPKAPKVVVRMDEIEKSIGANVSGPVGDNTGVSQSIFKTLLTSMEDNGWMGCLLLGGPGAGKTLHTSAVANTFKCLSLVGDLNAAKASLVGESEARVRRMMDVLYSLGGDRVLILGTCNKLGVMPPEFLRRFSLGIWYFSTPTNAEKKEMWKIQCAKHGISMKQAMPDDDGWVGSDIRNCVQRAWMLGCPLLEASKFITISGKVSAKDVAQLEVLSESSGFLCANEYGTYKRDREEKTEGRRITV